MSEFRSPESIQAEYESLQSEEARFKYILDNLLDCRAAGVWIEGMSLNTEQISSLLAKIIEVAETDERVDLKVPSDITYHDYDMKSKKLTETKTKIDKSYKFLLLSEYLRLNNILSSRTRT